MEPGVPAAAGPTEEVLLGPQRRFCPNTDLISARHGPDQLPPSDWVLLPAEE